MWCTCTCRLARGIMTFRSYIGTSPHRLNTWATCTCVRVHVRMYRLLEDFGLRRSCTNKHSNTLYLYSAVANVVTWPPMAHLESALGWGGVRARVEDWQRGTLGLPLDGELTGGARTLEKDRERETIAASYIWPSQVYKWVHPLVDPVLAYTVFSWVNAHLRVSAHPRFIKLLWSVCICTNGFSV